MSLATPESAPLETQAAPPPTENTAPQTEIQISEAMDVQKWRERIADFLAWRDREINEDENKRFLEYYQAQYYRARSGNPRGGVPLIFTFVDVKMSTLDGSPPTLEAKPRDFRYDSDVNAAEATLLYEILELNWRAQWSKAHLMAHCTDYGGWLKVGWRSQYGDGAQAESNAAGQRVGTDGAAIEHDVNIRADHPWVRFLDGRDVAFDTASGLEIDEVAWAAVRYRRLPEDMANDPTFRPIAIQRMESRIPKNAKARQEPIEAWEVWDARTKMLYHVSDLCPDVFLKDPSPWPIDVEGIPLLHLKFYDAVTGDGRIRPIFGMASVRTLFSMNEQRNKFRTNALISSDRMLPKYYGDKDVFDGNGQQVFESKVIGAFIPTRPGKQLNVLQQGNVSSDARMIDQLAMDDFRFASAVDEHTAGVAGQSGTTATETISKDRYAGVRTNNMGTSWDDFLSRLLRKVLLLIKKYYPPGRIVPVFDSGTGKVVDWTKFTDEWRNAEYDIVRIQPGSTRARSREAEQAQIINLANTLSQLIPNIITAEVTMKQAGKTMDGMALLKVIMRKFHPEISASEIQEIFPQEDMRSPHEENMVMQGGGQVFVLPEDNDVYHLRWHVQFAMAAQMGQFGDISPEILQAVMGHIQEHKDAQMLEQSPEPLTLQGGGGGMGGQQQALMPPGTNGRGMEGPPITPGMAGGMANAEMGQTVNQGGGGMGGMQAALGAAGGF